jgi:hypothetical protein
LGGGSPLEKFCEVKGVLLVSISTDLCEISRESSEEDGPVAAGDLGISISWRAWLRREREARRREREDLVASSGGVLEGGRRVIWCPMRNQNENQRNGNQSGDTFANDEVREIDIVRVTNPQLTLRRENKEEGRGREMLPRECLQHSSRCQSQSSRVP